MCLDRRNQRPLTSIFYRRYLTPEARDRYTQLERPVRPTAITHEMLSLAILFAACAASAIAQSTTTLPATSANTTVTATVLIGTLTTGLAASVVSASACGDTTYVFECTDTLACSDLPPVRWALDSLPWSRE